VGGHSYTEWEGPSLPLVWKDRLTRQRIYNEGIVTRGRRRRFFSNGDINEVSI
jgi:hypothetical protein